MAEKESPQDMALFNIKVVVNQTGLNPATIRAWERRYGFPKPQRTAGGHRQYTQRDVDALNWLIGRQNEGMSISHAVNLWNATSEMGEDPFEEAVPPIQQLPPAAPTISGDQIDHFRKAWTDACLEFDRTAAEKIISRAFAVYPPEIVCYELLRKGLSDVGERWFRGEITVQQEHFTSALSAQRVEMLIATEVAPFESQRVMVINAPGDYHVFSPLLITYLLRRRGWDVVYLGANVPQAELESALLRVRPDLVVASAQMLPQAADLAQIAVSLEQHDIPLAYGGLAFINLPGLINLFPGFYLGTLEEAPDNVADLLNKKPAPGAGKKPSDASQQALDHYYERRALIEYQVWGSTIVNENSRIQLAEINNDFSENIKAALKMGDLTSLGGNRDWISYILASYRLSESWIDDYIGVYHQAARNLLGESGGVIVSWLSQLSTG